MSRSSSPTFRGNCDKVIDVTDVDAFQQADPDPDWQFAAELCAAIAADGLATATRGVDRIRAEQPEYATIERADHLDWVHGQLSLVLEGLASRSLPTAAQAKHARLIGARRAEQGVPVGAVLNSFHVGYRELWNTMLDKTLLAHPLQADRLLGLVNLLWAWVAAMTSAAADGYAETARTREETRSRLGHQLLEALYGGQAAVESSVLLARAIGLDPQGSFQAVCCSAAHRPGQDADMLTRRLRSITPALVAITRGPVLVIVFQKVPASKILDVVRDSGNQVDAGIGIIRDGLVGAADSIADAERALALAERQGGTVDYETDWLPATLLPHLDRLEPILDPGNTPAQAHLREAILAYAANGFAITASARELHIHPNTMKYRLERWQELTGWNPQTLDGLLRSSLGISFSAETSASNEDA
jgi:hypothetical protein